MESRRRSSYTGELARNFLGARGGNADQREFYRARAIDDLIADPTVPEERKELLRIERAKLNPKHLRSSAEATEDQPAIDG